MSALGMSPVSRSICSGESLFQTVNFPLCPTFVLPSQVRQEARGAGAMHFPPAWQVGSDNTSAGRVLGNQLLLRVSFVKKRELHAFLDGPIPPLPPELSKGGRFFSSFYCENPIQCLEVNLTKCGTPPLQQLGPRELLFFRLTPPELSASHQTQGRFPTPVLAPRLVAVCKDVGHPSLQACRQRFAMYPYPSQGLSKRC